MRHSIAQGQWCLFAVLISSFFITMAASVLPRILFPTDDTISTIEGDSCVIQCTVSTMWPKFHLVYWLVNNTFVEDMYPDGRVKEVGDSINKSSTSWDVSKALVFTSTQTEDFTRTFTCIIQDPSGVATKNITLTPQVKKATTQKAGGNTKPSKSKRHSNAKTCHNQAAKTKKQ